MHVASSRHLGSGTGAGLFESLKKAMKYVSIESWTTKMIGFGCDGASANMADGEVKGQKYADL